MHTYSGTQNGYDYYYGFEPFSGDLVFYSTRANQRISDELGKCGHFANAASGLKSEVTKQKGNSMVNRREPRKIQHRQKCSWRTYDAINRRSCLHVDAWLIELDDGTLMFIIETRAGGQDLMAQRMFIAEPGKLIESPALGGIDVAAYPQRRIDGRWARANAPWLNALHNEHIQPRLHDDMPGFKGYRSIALHYVWSDPKISNPFEGVRNYYGGTGYAERWQPAPLTAPEVEAATKPQRSPWSRSDRSMLRTLDKIIKG